MGVLIFNENINTCSCTKFILKDSKLLNKIYDKKCGSTIFLIINFSVMGCTQSMM
ncbi:hypothetical protein PROVALCAL_03453 [Providencia alcalifaciens DSM 30120]|uniref:Uncharacterized protein n=1 Tax=Providencia alcalifaciens DSM 30120 TaxID=520999 RepID=B6XJA3_9GAMM|nr:hypothetical protein PROVALCAL_03453 [Providencia alcalifaciens DSM 30120]